MGAESQTQPRLTCAQAKGQDAARNGHIAFNVLALGLFTWQLPTGWEILLKVRVWMRL